MLRYASVLQGGVFLVLLYTVPSNGNECCWKHLHELYLILRSRISACSPHLLQIPGSRSRANTGAVDPPYHQEAEWNDDMPKAETVHSRPGNTINSINKQKSFCYTVLSSEWTWRSALILSCTAASAVFYAVSITGSNGKASVVPEKAAWWTEIPG